MDVNHTPVRVDLRCGVCRQKNVFVCEHDTPYRDQYLGIFDSNAPRDTIINSQRSKNEPKKNNKSISNGGMNKGQQVHSNAGGSGTQHQNNKKSNKTNVDHETTTESSNTQEQNQKPKSCVVL